MLSDGALRRSDSGRRRLPNCRKRESSPYGSRRGGRDDVSGFFGFIKQRRGSHTPSQSRDSIRPSFANSFAPKTRGTQATLKERAQAIPRGTQAIPRGTQAIPRGTQAIPRGTQAIPRGTQAIPRGTQGRPGARCTRGLMCKANSENAHEHTGSAEAVRPSLRDGFTAYSVLSPARPELVCHRHSQEA
jgi:hypothetical protein